MSNGAQTCPSCGATSPADAQFCRDCGAILVRGGSSQKTTPLAGDPTFAFEGGGPGSPRPPQKNRTPLVAAVIVVLLLLAVGLFFFGKHETSQIPVPGEAPTEVPTEAAPTEPPPPPARAPTRPPLPPPGAAREPEPPREAEPPRAPDIVREAPEPPTRREPERLPERAAPRDLERRREREPEPERPMPSVQSDEGGRVFRAGWYRVKFRAPLFQSPSETAPVVTYLRPGTRIRVTHVLPGFLAVESTTGKAPGYVSTDDAEPEAASGR